MAEFETRQILIGHEFLWRALNVWARSQRLRLLRMEVPKVGATVELLPSRELWEVVAVYKHGLPEDVLKENQRLNRRSLPSIESMA